MTADDIKNELMDVLVKLHNRLGDHDHDLEQAIQRWFRLEQATREEQK